MSMQSKSVRELNKKPKSRRPHRVDADLAAGGKGRWRGSPTPRRKFTDSFCEGDVVYIKKHKHGYNAGNGKITVLTDYSATVTSGDGEEYDIQRPGDLTLLCVSKRKV